jgi:hypothetical protein
MRGSFNIRWSRAKYVTGYGMFNGWPIRTSSSDSAILPKAECPSVHTANTAFFVSSLLLLLLLLLFLSLARNHVNYSYYDVLPRLRETRSISN